MRHQSRSDVQLTATPPNANPSSHTQDIHHFTGNPSPHSTSRHTLTTLDSIHVNLQNTAPQLPPRTNTAPTPNIILTSPSSHDQSITSQNPTHTQPVTNQANSNISPQQQRLTTPDDNYPSGDLITQAKQKETLRIYFQNINGISKNNWLEWQHAASLIAKHDIDVFGCAETNILWTESTRKFAQHQLQRHTKQANIAVACHNEPGYTSYQPGEVTSCITGRWTGRIIHVRK
jgi:hypothetical protein